MVAIHSGKITNYEPNLLKSADMRETTETDDPITGVWPARDVVAKLVEASDILLGILGYDGHGWEQLHSAREEARKFLKQ